MNEQWPCPALERVIDGGLCWELAMAEHGGPVDAADDLRRWVAESKYRTIAEFQSVCEGCSHCPWRRTPAP